MMPGKTVVYGGTVVNTVIGPGVCYLRTVLPDGKSVGAVPQHDAESVARAKALGYDNVDDMTMDHDRLHALLAHAFGMRESPTLRRMADGLPPNEVSDAEEQMVLAAQRFLNLCRRQGLSLRV